MNIVDCVLLVCNRLNSWAELRGRKGFPTTYRCLVNFVHSMVEFYSSDTGDRHASTSQKHGTYAARYEPYSCHLIFQLDAIRNNKVFSFSSSPPWIRVLLLLGQCQSYPWRMTYWIPAVILPHTTHISQCRVLPRLLLCDFCSGKRVCIWSLRLILRFFFRSRHISSTLT